MFPHIGQQIGTRPSEKYGTVLKIAPTLSISEYGNPSDGTYVLEKNQPENFVRRFLLYLGGIFIY